MLIRITGIIGMNYILSWVILELIGVCLTVCLVSPKLQHSVNGITLNSTYEHQICQWCSVINVLASIIITMKNYGAFTFSCVIMLRWILVSWRPQGFILEIVLLFNPPPQSGEGIIGMHFVRPSVCPLHFVSAL